MMRSRVGIAHQRIDTVTESVVGSAHPTLLVEKRYVEALQQGRVGIAHRED